MSPNCNPRFGFLMVCLLAFCFLADLSYARDNFVRDLIQSLSDQHGAPDQITDLVRDQRVASVSPVERNLRDGELGSSPKSSDTSNDSATVNTRKYGKDRTVLREMLFPGASSVDMLGGSLIKLASLSPTFDQSANCLSVLDSHESLGSFGKLASEPFSLYTNFLIEVDKSTYTVNLSGFKENGEKNLLYTCRAGLGSPEYPTPRGTFYIIRIFDDNPLWIPPQDREWAAGEVPSRTVYGGHMMPFFSKFSALSNRRTEIVIDDEDVVAAPIKMVDAGAYRIHGTNSPWSIGSGQSHGCVRLLNKTVAQLADTLKMYVGTTTRGQTANGVYINLAKPVKLVLY